MKKGNGIITAIIGAALLAAGFFLGRRFENAQDIMSTLPYIFIGIGAGLFGHGIGGMLERRVLKNHPEIQKTIEIEKNDERNIALTNRAKGKAYDIMIPAFGALMVSFALMGVELFAVLALVIAYLFVVGCNIYYRVKFEKEM